jgi:arsenate reductase
MWLAFSIGIFTFVELSPSLRSIPCFREFFYGRGGVLALKFYGYKKCGTCRKAEKDLEEKGMAYEFIDITLNPPSAKHFKEMVKISGLELKRFYNTSGKKYKELSVKDLRKTLSEAEQLDLLASDGYLMKRPLVSDGQKVTVGFKQDEFDEVWG